VRLQVLLFVYAGLLALTGIAPFDASCHRYDPTRVTVAKPAFSLFSTPLWRIESGSVLVEQASTQSDAERVAILAGFYSEECQIGPATASYQPVTYWRDPVKPLALPFSEDCTPYDSNRLTVISYEGRSFLKPLDLSFPGEQEAEAALALAQQYKAMCMIGRGSVPQPGSDPYLRRESREAQSEAASEVHFVYYWK